MAQLPEFMDVTRVMKDFDPAKFADQFSSMLKQYKLPGVDIDALVASSRKNVEAVTHANRVAFEGMQAFARRQAEMLQEAMNETTKAFESISKAGSPPEAAAKQVEITKNAFERAVGNAREMSEMVSKANQDATNSINARISEQLDEIRDMALKAQQAKK